jgi:hypothetical protein
LVAISILIENGAGDVLGKRVGKHATGARRLGGSPGNHDAFLHGFYATQLEVLSRLTTAMKIGSLED